MEHDTYRNGVLTVIAVLLTVLTWTQLSGRSFLASEAQAQIRSKPVGTTRVPEVEPGGVSSIGQRSIVQRDQIIAAVEALRATVDGMSARLARGDLRVQVVESTERPTSRTRQGARE